MEVNSIRDKYNELSSELKHALSTMERKDRVFVIRDEIKDLQKLCPHNSGNYDFSTSDECPYCHAKFEHKKSTETDPDWVHGIKMY